MTSPSDTATNRISSGMLAEFEKEVETTERFLNRLPEDKLTWQPHEKSMTAGQLAFHIAALLKGVLQMGLQDSAELPDFTNNYQPTIKSEILAALQESKQFVEEHLPNITDGQMKEEIRITKDGQVVMASMRVGFLRSVLLNHWYQHRGQFGVYLRLIGVDVPWSYGPSADEAPGG